ncbi:MAG: FAD-binding protein [Chloroflexi bacterium]|nr:FAD-binding protein [Chloroflexota bacterium]
MGRPHPIRDRAQLIVPELRGAELGRRLVELLGEDKVLWRPQDLLLYEYDGAVDTSLPDAVVLPSETADVAKLARFCSQHQVPLVPRGAGTGLSGGAIPVFGGIVVSFARMSRILEIDVADMRAVVQPGLINLHLSTAAAPYGLYFVPDPSSQKACTLGGNVAENSGGPHTLAYGVTTNHVTGLEVVLSDGSVVRLGGKALEHEGYDLVGLFVGSEGTLGIVTEITVKLTPLPEDRRTILAAFPTMDQASETVSAIIAAGIVPAAIELMDALATEAVEAAVHAGYPLDADGILLVEVDGVRDGLDEQRERIEEICRAQGATTLRVATSTLDRERLWAGRKGAFAAMGRLAPDYYVQDGVIPRTRLPAILRHVREVGERYGVRIANVFHAGDGNLHPLILFDGSAGPAVLEEVKQAGFEIVAACVEAGGSLTGEHGIGMEKNCYMPLQFTAEDLATMRRIKAAWDPLGLMNPGKVFPTPGRCKEYDLRAAAPRGSARASRTGAPTPGARAEKKDRNA